MIRGGSLALGTTIADTLTSVATFVPGSVRIHSGAGTFTWDGPSRTITLNLGDVDPMYFVGMPVAEFDVDVTIPTDGYSRILDSTMIY